MILHFLFIAIYLMMANVMNLDGSFINAGVIVHCVIATLLKLNKSTKFVTPLTVFFLSGVVVSLGNIVVINQIGSEKTTMNAYMVADHVDEASIIWAIGLTCIFIGFDMFPTYRFPSLRLDVTKRLSYRMFPTVLTISLFASQIINLLLFLGSVTKLLYLFGTVGIMFYARLWATYDDLKYARYAVILYVVQTYLAFSNSYLRSELLLPTVVFFAGYFVGRGHVRSLFSYRVLPFVAIFALFISTFSTLGKYRANFSSVISQELLNQSDSDFAEYSNDLYDLENERAGSFLERSAIMAQVTNCVQLVKKKGFYNGFVTSPMIYALIPRFLWPEKPAVSMGQWFAVEIGTAYIGSNGGANNSINMTIMGEMYLDFGWAGIVIGCFLYGMLVSMLWNSLEYYASPYNIIGILFGGYVLLLSFGIGADLQLMVTYTSTFLMFYALKRIVLDYF